VEGAPRDEFLRDLYKKQKDWDHWPDFWTPAVRIAEGDRGVIAEKHKGEGAFRSHLATLMVLRAEESGRATAAR